MRKLGKNISLAKDTIQAYAECKNQTCSNMCWCGFNDTSEITRLNYIRLDYAYIHK